MHLFFFVRKMTFPVCVCSAFDTRDLYDGYEVVPSAKVPVPPGLVLRTRTALFTFAVPFTITLVLFALYLRCIRLYLTS